MLARRYEQMTRGPAAGTPHPSPETFNPQEAVNWWDKQNDPVMREGYTGPRFKLVLECGHEVTRYLVRDCTRVKCGECLGPGYNRKGFKEDT